MDLLQLLVLALIQGVTEFLPISSSAHLILVPVVTGWPDQGLAFDLAVHLGTLVAVLLYCWRDIARMTGGLFLALRGRSSAGGRMLLFLIIATIPLVMAGGALVYLGATDIFRSIEVVAWATLGFGLLLWLADISGMTVRRIEHMTAGSALTIGCFQVLALIPGTSRSGITMTAGRLLGFERAEAARFSLLLSIPAILASGGHAVKEIAESGNAAFTANVAIAMAVACLTALPAIALMMAWLRRSGYGIFVIYRVILGLGLLAVAYGFV